MRGFAVGLLIVTVLLGSPVAGGGVAGSGATVGGLVEVVVTLPQLPLAEAVSHDRRLAAEAATRDRLNLRAPASVSYLRVLALAQRDLESRVERVIPQALVRWHYSVVLNGMAVVVPRAQLPRLSGLRGATVWPSVTYHTLLAPRVRYRGLLDQTPQLIGAPTLWGPTLATAGQGMKIGILDDGLDQTHVFFNPAGFSYPLGFPKGDTSYTTAKVIVARTFTPAQPMWKYASLPFDPTHSVHATNVAGIAAGDRGTVAILDSGRYDVSGIAPAAYLGNYKVLTVPTATFGLDGNSPEIAAGIEQAVRDGMDVINLSLGEPEVEPKRDIVVQALDGAAAAGVVPVVAAGNDYAEAGRGSISSPANAPQAIAVAASTGGDGEPIDEIADFSSSGPTPISLELKPDVTAPGVDLLSSLPNDQWSDHSWSGTSMATPHVAGAAAVLKQRHPTWTVGQIKSALESTGDPVHAARTNTEVATTREGGGRINLPRADTPLIFTDPTSLSFGLVQRDTTLTRQLAITDAGGGPAAWTISILAQSMPTGASITASAPVVVPGGLVAITVTVAADAAEGEATGFIVLTRGGDVRRVPYWYRVEAPKLASEPQTTIPGPGTYRGDTVGRPSLVSSYRYPEGDLGAGISTNLSGPEQVFRFTLTRPVANFGAVVTWHAPGVGVTLRLTAAGDENRLVGYTGLPVDLNPYGGFGRAEPVVGAVLPQPGTYNVVFDTPAGAHPGPFRFRFWVNDTTPPTVRLLTPHVRRGATIRLSVTDAGSGADPASFALNIDRAPQRYSYARGVILVPDTAALTPGSHHLTFVAADYQETKNTEDVGPILPNTRTFETTLVVH